MYALFVETLGTFVHDHDENSIDNTFSTNHQPNQVTEMSLRYLQNMSIYFPSGNFQFVPLLLHNTSCPVTISTGTPLKRMTGGDDKNM